MSGTKTERKHFGFLAATALGAALFAFGGAVSSAHANEVTYSGTKCRNLNGAGGKFKKDYYVYFETNSSRVDPKYHDDLKHIYEFAKGQHAGQICLFGKSSKTGDAKDNAALGRKRARNVAVIFEKFGWPRKDITVETEGEAWGWLQETLTWDAPEDRRVRIRLSR
ncbi:outer membrane protein OmpA-like peptidoglycan-associated protein [Parvibaculum indicum]|uniref:OmpA family protein n=1 Tax=Parvibaculum indicum TaxID=562969 RepID=UPI00141DD08D|nr:OmpA family protein [Parvibaculum indicum]NIJ42513.1 outer membrane protein OmpA-like peptidoglycan-associated protein [Parvibaculum indicum]